MSILNHAHKLVDANEIDSERPTLVPAVFAPLAFSDIGAPFHSEVFSTDASDNMGAIWSRSSAGTARQRVPILA